MRDKHYYAKLLRNQEKEEEQGTGTRKDKVESRNKVQGIIVGIDLPVQFRYHVFKIQRVKCCKWLKRTRVRIFVFDNLLICAFVLLCCASAGTHANIKHVNMCTCMLSCSSHSLIEAT